MNSSERLPGASGRFPPPGSGEPQLSAGLDDLPLIPYADSPRGLLAQGNESTLRRHVLGAQTFAESARRVEAIQQAAHVQMGDRFRDVEFGRVGQRVSMFDPVHVACLGWPVVITIPRELRVHAVYPLNALHSRPLAREMMGCIRLSYDTVILEATPLALYQTPLLLGLSPLWVHQLLATFKRALKSSSTPSYRDCQLPIVAPRELTMIGPWHPVSMVLPVLVAWRQDQYLQLGSGLRNAQARLQHLVAGLYTHYRPSPKNGGTWLDWQELTLQPTVSVGKPELLFEAATQGQWMQLAKIAELARKSASESRYSQQTQGDFRLVEYELSTNDEVLSTLHYAYKPFWQPTGHREMVDAQLSFAQIMGCMPGPTPLDLH